MYRVFFVVLLLIVSQTASLVVNAEEKSKWVNYSLPAVKNSPQIFVNDMPDIRCIGGTFEVLRLECPVHGNDIDYVEIGVEYYCPECIKEKVEPLHL